MQFFTLASFDLNMDPYCSVIVLLENMRVGKERRAAIVSLLK